MISYIVFQYLLALFKQNQSTTLYQNNSNCSIYLLVYINDILISGNNPQVIRNLIQSLDQAFALKTWVFPFLSQRERLDANISSCSLPIAKSRNRLCAKIALLPNGLWETSFCCYFWRLTKPRSMLN